MFLMMGNTIPVGFESQVHPLPKLTILVGFPVGFGGFPVPPPSQMQEQGGPLVARSVQNEARPAQGLSHVLQCERFCLQSTVEAPERSKFWLCVWCVAASVWWGLAGDRGGRLLDLLAELPLRLKYSLAVAVWWWCWLGPPCPSPRNGRWSDRNVCNASPLRLVMVAITIS